MTLYNYPLIKWHKVMNYDNVAKIYRFGRLLWGKQASNPAYKYCLTFGLRKSLGYFHVECSTKGYKKWILCVLGLRLHFKQDERGILV